MAPLHSSSTSLLEHTGTHQRGEQTRGQSQSQPGSAGALGTLASSASSPSAHQQVCLVALPPACSARVLISHLVWLMGSCVSALASALLLLWSTQRPPPGQALSSLCSAAGGLLFPRTLQSRLCHRSLVLALLPECLPPATPRACFSRPLLGTLLTTCLPWAHPVHPLPPPWRVPC